MCKLKTRSDSVKIILMAAEFSNASDVFTKFLAATNESRPKNTNLPFKNQCFDRQYAPNDCYKRNEYQRPKTQRQSYRTRPTYNNSTYNSKERAQNLNVNASNVRNERSRVYPTKNQTDRVKVNSGVTRPSNHTPKLNQHLKQDLNPVKPIVHTENSPGSQRKVYSSKNHNMNCNLTIDNSVDVNKQTIVIHLISDNTKFMELQKLLAVQAVIMLQ